MTQKLTWWKQENEHELLNDSNDEMGRDINWEILNFQNKIKKQ